MRKITVAVVFGGRSVEHEVSIISALQAINNLNKEKYDVLPVYISKNGEWYTGEALLKIDNFRDLPALLSSCRKAELAATHNCHRLLIRHKGVFTKDEELLFDVMLPVTHGTQVEDGCLQGLLELLNVPYAGPGVLSGAVGMDKVIMKAVLKENDIPLVPYVWFTADEWAAAPEKYLDKVEAEIGYPVIVKPANLGSSVGVGKATDRAALKSATCAAAAFSRRLMVEKCVENLREINCSVLGMAGEARASVCEEPVTANDFLTYQDKYTSGTKGMSGSKRIIPAELDEATTKLIQELACRTFAALDGCGVSRIDFLLDKNDNQVYVNEINTIPGSLSFYLWKPTGLSYPQLLDELIALAFKRQRIKDSLTFSYDTNILASASAGFKGGIKK